MAKFARPSIRLIPRRAEMSEIGLGESRFNGDPDLPPGFEWPEFEGRNLLHLAQIDLSTIDVPDLPNSGWICFFYECVEQRWGFDPKDSGAFRVVWFDVPRSTLVRFPHPPLHDPAMKSSPCLLEMRSVPSLPSRADQILSGQELFISQFDADHEEVSQPYNKAVCELRGDDCDDEFEIAFHHMLGWPGLQQNCLRLECEMVTSGLYCGNGDDYTAAEEAGLPERSLDADWIVLLQLSSSGDEDDGTNWMWGDAGRLYFMIRRQDLLDRRFDKTWMIMQCG